LIILCSCQDILKIEVVDVAVGKVTVKVPAAVFVLSEPKSNTATAAPVVELYIKAALAVKEAGFQVILAKLTYAVSFEAS
jgi:hypothetical protein